MVNVLNCHWWLVELLFGLITLRGGAGVLDSSKVSPALSS